MNPEKPKKKKTHSVYSSRKSSKHGKYIMHFGMTYKSSGGKTPIRDGGYS